MNYLLGLVYYGGAIGVNKIYQKIKKQQKKKQLEQIQRKTTLQIDEKDNEWDPILLPQKDLDYIPDMQQQLFKQLLKRYCCPISNKVMKHPVFIPCCYKAYQKSALAIRTREKNLACPNCHKKFAIEDVVSHQGLKKQIQDFRYMIRKKYTRLFFLKETEKPMSDSTMRQLQKWQYPLRQKFGLHYHRNNL